MTQPTLVVQIAWGDDPLTEDGAATWVDIGSYVRQELSVHRGRNHERDLVQAGTATLTLSNTDRRFDPDNTAGPYFPNVLPMRKIRIGASYDVASYLNPEWIFVGYVESWKMRYEGGTIAYADLTCVDAFKYFSLIDIVQYSTSPSELSDVRVTRVLDAIINVALDPLWPTGDRVIATGDITLPEMEVNDTALGHIQKIVKAEDGLFFISRSGDATFQNQNYRDGLSSAAQFSNDPAGADLPYTQGGLVTRFDDTNIWNQIKVTAYESDVPQLAFDATSRDTYLTRTLIVSDALLLDDNAAMDRGERLLGRYKDARVRPERFVIDPSVRDSWKDVIERDLSDIVTIEREYLIDGDTMTIDAHIEAIGVVKRGNKWRFTWQLSPVFTIPPWVGTLQTLSIWRAPTLAGAWMNQGSPYLDAGYWKDKDGWVHLRGTIEGDATNTTAFTLPVGYRPPGDAYLPLTAENVNVGQLFITTAGVVKPLITAGTWVTGNFVTLAGSFRVF